MGTGGKRDRGVARRTPIVVLSTVLDHTQGTDKEIGLSKSRKKSTIVHTRYSRYNSSIVFVWLALRIPFSVCYRPTMESEM